MDRTKFCIVADLPDGLNVFAGFDVVINPATGAKTYFNVWDITLNNAARFRSEKQATLALKMVDRDGLTYARVEPLDKILKIEKTKQQ